MAKHPALMKRKSVSEPEAGGGAPGAAKKILASPSKASPTGRTSWTSPLGGPGFKKKRPSEQAPLGACNKKAKVEPKEQSDVDDANESTKSFEGDVIAEARGEFCGKSGAEAAAASPAPSAAAAARPAPESRRGAAGDCYVLACKYDEPRKNADCPDHLRLDSLQRLYPGLKVIGCSEYVPRNEKRRSADAEIVAQNAKSETHVSANFKKTLRDIVKRTDPKVVMLDYFWLQPGYYEERYGMNWLSSKIRELFVSYKCEVLLLPVDSRGAVKRMYDGSFADRPAGIAVDFVSEADGLKHHPLVRATRKIDGDLRSLAERVTHAKGRWHDMQKLRLAAPHPFVVAYRAGVDWKAYLDGLCRDAPEREPRPEELRPLVAAPPKAKGRSPSPRSPRPRSPAPPAAAAADDSDDEDTPISVLLARRSV